MENNISAFIWKMKWMTATDEFQDIRALTIDCFAFVFESVMGKDLQYELFEYMERLDFRYESAVIKTAVWLMQKEIPFTLKFKWNRILPIRYNLSKWKRPKIIFQQLQQEKEQLMAWDLDELAKL